MLPCVIFEDEHLLVVNKPAGMNTHAPAPYAGEGIYDWLRNREPRWASLAIIQRLDKETSGVMVFGKSTMANRSLTEQFTGRDVRKKYLLLTDRPLLEHVFSVKSSLVRVGEKYVSRALHKGADVAETRFGVPASAGSDHLKAGLLTVIAEPLTGRTHQIRVHAASSGFPVLGDTLYGGSPFHRVCLHATELTLKHPASGKDVTFQSKPDFDSDTRLELRNALIDNEETNAFRIIHGASDGWPGWYVDRIGDFLLSQSEQPLTAEQNEFLRLESNASLTNHGTQVASVYHKRLTREVQRKAVADASPQFVSGKVAPDRFAIRENGAQFELSFKEGYSMGLFLDQRDNRLRFLTGYVAPGFVIGWKDKEVLNTFSYTCGFSVCAALAGARVTSVDLSKKYLEWGKRNFALNDLDSSPHDFIYGDAFDWLRRLAKKERMFDAIVVDPPTFSQSKESGVFRVEKDYGRLVSAALPLIKPGGVLFASTNAAGWPPDDFLSEIEIPIKASRRKIIQRHYAPQPPDFPVSRAEPAYLKTVWMRIS